jgi:hypothetical protein
MAALRSAGAPVYQLKVTLAESDPAIWRRVQVAGDISLAKLHQLLQIVMGWQNSHLHQFIVDGTAYGESDPALGELELRDERKTRLGQVAPIVGSRFIYEYDFGDSWQHEIRVEQIAPAEPGMRYPVCLAGERACPPEDCGGIWGYTDLLEAVRDPDHPEHAEMMEWLEGDFDPEAFNLDATNQALKRLR